MIQVGGWVGGWVDGLVDVMVDAKGVLEAASRVVQKVDVMVSMKVVEKASM